MTANDRPALWQQERLRAHWDFIHCDFAACHERLQRLLSEMEGYSEGSAPRFQIFQRNSVEVQLAVVCWLVGEPSEAWLRIGQAAEHAIETAHGPTLVHCLSSGVIWLMHMFRDYARSRIYTDLLKKTIDRDGLSGPIPLVTCYSEAVNALSGFGVSPAGLRMALNRLSNAATQIRSHGHFAILAEAMIAIGQFEDARSAIDFTFKEGAQRWVLPELLRIRALTEKALGHESDSAITLRDSLRRAEEASCLAWKLRSSIDLARLLRDQHKLRDAQHILAPVYDQFDDGFETADLSDCRELLSELDT